MYILIILFLFILYLSFQVSSYQKSRFLFISLLKKFHDVDPKVRANPFETTYLDELLSDLKNKVNHFIFQESQSYRDFKSELIQELQRKKDFQSLYSEITRLINQKFYKKAVSKIKSARQLYAIEALDSLLDECNKYLLAEERYLELISEAKLLFDRCDLRLAIQKTTEAIAIIERDDGISLLEKLTGIKKLLSTYQSGLKAEQKYRFSDAINFYKKAYESSEFTEFMDRLTDYKHRYRLAYVYIKAREFSKALEYIQSNRRFLDEDEILYLEGQISYLKNDLDQSLISWNSIQKQSEYQIQEKIQVIHQLQREFYLNKLAEIENEIKKSNYDKAYQLSLNYLQLSDGGKRNLPQIDLCKRNLDHHIIPVRKRLLFTNGTTNEIFQHCEEEFLKNPCIEALHNLAISSYYSVMNGDFSKTERFISAWITNIANLSRETSLKKSLWIDFEVDINTLKDRLLKLIESRVLDLQNELENDKYMRIINVFRCDLAAYDQLKGNLRRGIYINNIWLSPSLYRFLRSSGCSKASSNLSTDQYYYSDLGIAITAFEYGDIATARKLADRKLETNSKIQEDDLSYSHKLFYYYNGLAYLNEVKTQEAFLMLNKVKKFITNSTELKKKVNDELFKCYSVVAEDSSDLEKTAKFAEDWFNLFVSDESKKYYIESHVRLIYKNYAKSLISIDKALRQLNDLLKIDSKSSYLLDAIKELSIQKELDLIHSLFQSNNIEMVVIKARSSQYPEVRYKVAKVLADIALEIVENKYATFSERQLAYRLISDARQIYPQLFE
ncbi:PDDEXK family nuclease [Thermosynechococcus sp. FA-CM-4201]